MVASDENSPAAAPGRDVNSASKRASVITPAAPWVRTPVRFFLGVLLISLAIAGAERGWRAWSAASSEPGRGASWIWASDVTRQPGPVAFYAAKDFIVGELRPSQLTLVADESYQLWLNGRKLGSGRSQPNAPAHRYDTSNFLHEGNNRLVVELTSSRGAGGLLLNLRWQDGEEILRSDDSWSILRHYEPALFGGWSHLEELAAEAPKVWQGSPTGRWRPRPAVALLQPTFSTTPVKPYLPRQLRHPADGSPWMDLTQRTNRLPVMGWQAIYDFGETVSGHLSLDLHCSDDGPALLFFGDKEPDVSGPPDEVLISVDGSCQWIDPCAHSYRYVAIVGRRVEGRITVEPAPPDIMPETASGVFGLAPAKDYTPVEELVWDRLRERLPNPDS